MGFDGIYVNVGIQETYDGTLYHHVIFKSKEELIQSDSLQKIKFGSLTCKESIYKIEKLGCFIVHRRYKIHIYANKNLTQQIISAFG
jgi:hypothetical protein